MVDTCENHENSILCGLAGAGGQGRLSGRATGLSVRAYAPAPATHLSTTVCLFPAIYSCAAPAFLPHPRLTPQAPSPRFTHNPLENAGDNRYETGYIPTVRMKSSTQVRNPAQVQRWARRLDVRVGKVLAAHPHADPDNVRHTLILLEQPPLERLQRSLIRGRATAIFRK